jgi:hypothetical protein
VGTVDLTVAAIVQGRDRGRAVKSTVPAIDRLLKEVHAW